MLFYAGILNPWTAIVCVVVTVVLRRISLRYNLQTPADMELTRKVIEPVRRVVRVRRFTKNHRVISKKEVATQEVSSDQNEEGIDS